MCDELDHACIIFCYILTYSEVSFTWGAGKIPLNFFSFQWDPQQECENIVFFSKDFF